MKRNKGITLIALVITIIVLLILAGIAIAMLSGENGILKKAAEAKTKTEQAQKEEEITLIDYEIDSHFILNHSKYKCRYGYITGIGVKTQGEHNGFEIIDTVGDLKKELPEGYSINGEGITDETKLKTGIGVQKNGKIVAWTVVFGDNLCKGEIGSGMECSVSNQIAWNIGKYEDYQKVASDIDGDGYIDDIEMMEVYLGEPTNQNRYASKLKEVTRIPTKDIIASIEKSVICESNSIKKIKDENYGFIDRDDCYEIKLSNTYTYSEVNKEIKTRIKEVFSNISGTNFEDNTENNNEIEYTKNDKIEETCWFIVNFRTKVENGRLPEFQNIYFKITV